MCTLVEATDRRMNLPYPPGSLRYSEIPAHYSLQLVAHKFKGIHDPLAFPIVRSFLRVCLVIAAS